jgi:hypothetical protein
MVFDLAWIRNFDLRDLWTGIWQGKCISSRSLVNSKTFYLDIRKDPAPEVVGSREEIIRNSGGGENDFTVYIVLPDNYKTFPGLSITENELKFEPDFRHTYEIDLEKSVDNFGSPLITGEIIMYKKRVIGNGSSPAGLSWAMKDLSIEATFENIHIVK